MKRRILGHLLFIILLSISHAGARQSARIVRVGITIDGPWDRNREVISLLEKEVRAVVGQGADVRFPPEKVLEGDWTLGTVKKLNDRLLGDRDVDFIIAFGVFASQDLAQRGPLPKPCIAPVVIDPARQNIPYEKGASGVRNLNYLKFPNTMLRDIKVFQELVPFKHIVLISSKQYLDIVPALRRSDKILSDSLGLKFTSVYIDTSVDEVIAAIPKDADAAYLGAVLHLPPTEFAKLIGRLNALHLPTFSFLGESEVRQGVLAALNPDIFPRMNRRIALNLQRILNGEDASRLPVDFPAGKRLFLNASTAASIGVSPSWSTMVEAELLGVDTSVAAGARFSLRDAMRTALEANLDVAAKEREVRQAAEDVAIARSGLLPQVEISALGVQIDRDRAIGLQPERSMSGSIAVSQLVLAEPVWANVSVQSSLQRSEEAAYQERRLDITLDAAEAYLNYIRSQKTLHILLDNLKVARSNLEVAQIRQSTGSAEPGEPLRWESEIATSRRNVMTAESRMYQARFLMNQILNRATSDDFSAVDTSLETQSFAVSKSVFLRHFDNSIGIEQIASFLVSEGLRNSKEIAQLDALIAAQERSVVSTKLSYFLPSVSLFGKYTDNFHRSGTNSEVLLPYGKEDWSAGVQLSLPIFSGFATRAAQEKFEQGLEQLRLQRLSVGKKIELRIRSELQNVKASYFGRQQARLSAEAARKNYDIVAESYQRGVLPILNLLDAQNASLLASQVEANALYDFLIDFMRLQRAAGQYDILLEGADREAYIERVEKFFENK